MVLDTSAVVAVLFGEPGASQYTKAMRESMTPLRMSAAGVLEVTMVVEARRGTAIGERFGALVDTMEIEICPVDADLVAVAQRAWRRFGKGRHPAKLNFGDCFSYALATSLGEPLLFTGDDFTQTDVISAL